MNESATFYNVYPREQFIQQAELCKIYDKETGRCFDLEEVQQCLNLPTGFPATKRVLVAGVGFGREIKWLLENTSYWITAVDSCYKLVDEAKQEFQGWGRASIYKCDILDLPESLGTFDLILWMWSGITEFIGDQKLIALQNLTKCLKTGGILVIETVRDTKNIKCESEFVQGKNFVSGQNVQKTVSLDYNDADGEKAVFNLELISEQELDDLTRAAGLKQLPASHLYCCGTRILNLYQKIERVIDMQKAYIVETNWQNGVESGAESSDLFATRELAQKHLAECVQWDKKNGLCSRYLDPDKNPEDDDVFHVVEDTPDFFEASDGSSNWIVIQVAEKPIKTK